MRRLIFGGMIGAALAYFFDPENGERRRKMFVDRFGATTRTSTGQIQDLSAYASGKAKGAAVEASQTLKRATGQGKRAYDDVTLGEKVKTELFGAEPEIKGKVSVNVQQGVVQLRGELERSEEIDKAVKTAGGIDGVKEVENLLHLTGTAAPKS